MTKYTTDCLFQALDLHSMDLAESGKAECSLPQFIYMLIQQQQITASHRIRPLLEIELP